MFPNSAVGSVASHPSAVAAREHREAHGSSSSSGTPCAHEPSAVYFSAMETEEARPVHPDSKRLFSACDGRLGFVRSIPLFGRAIEAFGFKFVGALNITEFLSKGIANYSLQYSYYPMFCGRFGVSAMSYQRYQNVAMMGWSIKPLTALLSDSFAVFGYKKRWYMVVSAAAGAVCCFLYALLPASPTSAPTAAALLFLAGYSQANVDILSEGFYSRLMRKVPLAGPALVSTVWWMLSVGSIVAAFIEGPLSDGGKERLGGYISGACMAATLPFFLLNFYGEEKNRVERQEDFLIWQEELRKQRLAEDDDGNEAEAEETLESRAAAKNAELLVAADVIGNSRELPSGLTGLGDYSQDLVGFSLELASPDACRNDDVVHRHGDHHEEGVVAAAANNNNSTAITPSEEPPASAEPRRGSGVGVCDGVPPLDEILPDGPNDGDDDDDGVLGGPRIRVFCGGAVEFNQEVITRNWKVALYASLMTAGVIALAVVTILPGTYLLLFTCVGVSVGVAALSFWALPLVVAKASLFAFLNQMLYVQITGPLNSFYLATPDCLPNGPHFSYFFYNSITSVIASVANMVGVTVFTYVFAKRSYRVTFIVTTILEVIGSVFDLVMVKRWNVAIHIPDHVMYICGDAIVYQVAYMLNWMPMVVLLSQLCPRGSEAIVYALLAGFSNMGQTMATEIGTLLMDFVWPVTTTPPSACSFKNLPILIIVCHLCVPLVQIPLTFLLIPSAKVCDELDERGRAVKVKACSDHGAAQGPLSSSSTGDGEGDDGNCCHNGDGGADEHPHDEEATTVSDANDLLTPITANSSVSTAASSDNRGHSNSTSRKYEGGLTRARRSGAAFGPFSLSKYSNVDASGSRSTHHYQHVAVVPPNARAAAAVAGSVASSSLADPPLFEFARSRTNAVWAATEEETVGVDVTERTMLTSTAHHGNNEHGEDHPNSGGRAQGTAAGHAETSVTVTPAAPPPPQ